MPAHELQGGNAGPPGLARLQMQPVRALPRSQAVVHAASPVARTREIPEIIGEERARAVELRDQVVGVDPGGSAHRSPGLGQALVDGVLGHDVYQRRRSRSASSASSVTMSAASLISLTCPTPWPA